MVSNSATLRVWHFGFETFLFFNGIGIGLRKIWYRKKYRYRFQKMLVSKKYQYRFQKKLYWKKCGIEKIIGFGIKKNGIGKKFRIRFRSDFGFRHTLLDLNDNKRFYIPTPWNPLLFQKSPMHQTFGSRSSKSCGTLDRECSGQKKEVLHLQ